MGVVNRPAECCGPPNLQGSDRRGIEVQSQAQTRQVQAAPQVETAEAVACW